MKVRLPAWLVLVVLALAPTRWVPAQVPLSAFPDETAAVLRIASVDRLTGAFNELIGGLGPLAAVAGPKFEVGLAQALQLGTTIEGVDRGAPAFAAVFAMEGQSSEPVAWLVKASDEAKLRRAIVRPAADETLVAEPVDGGFEKLSAKNSGFWFFGRHGDAVIYTRNENVVKLLVAARGSPTNFAGLVEPRAAELLEAGDAAVLVNAARLTTAYAEQLKQAREQLIRQIENLPDDTLGGGGANAQAARKLYAQLAGMLFDGVADARWAGGRINFTASGVNLAAVLGVKQDSGSDQLLASSPPTSFDALGLLPTGAPVYFAYSVNAERAAALAQSYTPADSPRAKDRQAALDEARQAGPGPSVSSFSLPPDGTSGTITTTLQQAEQPELLRAARQKERAATNEVKTPLFNQSFAYQEAAETYQGRPVDIATLKVEMGKVDDPGLEVAQQFLRRFFGGDALQTRITVLEGLLVQASGNDPKFLQQAVDALGSGEGVLGLDEAYAKTRDQLADEANLVAMLNLPQVIVDLVKIAREIPLVNQFLSQAPFNFGAQPAASYAGISLGTEPQALRLQVFVPIEQPKGVLQIFGQGF